LGPSIHSASRSSSGSSLSFLRGATTGSSVCRPVFEAMQTFPKGQIKHFGEVGAHSVAPSSINPWLRSPGA
jgi:hypothetical protein